MALDALLVALVLLDGGLQVLVLLLGRLQVLDGRGQRSMEAPVGHARRSWAPGARRGARRSWEALVLLLLLLDGGLLLLDGGLDVGTRSAT